jgi:Raf kinase inhibitor-like YbhB/YbcL family protein
MHRRLLLILLVAGLVLALGVGCSQDAASEETGEDTSDAATEETAEEPTDEPAAAMELATNAFEDGGAIPAKYCNVGVDGGENVSIPLQWSGQPADAKSYALIIVDNHEVADEWVHWMVTGIPAETSSLGEGASGTAMPAGATELLSTNGESGYQGPQPPPGSGDHEYETILVALDVGTVDLAEDATYQEFLAVVGPHTVGQASVSGFFGR